MIAFLLSILGLSAIFAIAFWLSARTVEGGGSYGAIAGAGALILIGGGVYLLSGEPGYTAPRTSSIESPATDLARNLRPAAVEPLETYGNLVASGGGTKEEWLALAQALQAMGRSTETADALHRASDRAVVSEEKTNLLGAAGEILVQANRGVVTQASATYFEQALAIDPDSLGALFFLGRKARDDGDPELARRHWERFMGVAPEGHPLAASVTNGLTLLDAPRSGNALAPVLTPEMRQAFEGLTKSEQDAQIAAMLSRVDGRLVALGPAAAADEWRDLARAYQRVGMTDEAVNAYDQALERAPDDDAIRLERAQLLKP